jgi:uncharacterized membrane-anchored protein YitT (DUF2179 family)
MRAFQTAAPARAHTLFEDAQAIVTGALVVAFGLTLLKHAGLLTGGTAGLAFLIHYATGWNFGAVFFAVNLPFYGLAMRTLGPTFTLKTLAAVATLSLLVDLLPRWVSFGALDPVFAASMGGALVGIGLLILFRHKASLGGINVLALYLQEKHGLRAGAVQMALDCAIVVGAFAIVEPRLIALSILGALALNLVVAINHKPGRYLDV